MLPDPHSKPSGPTRVETGTAARRISTWKTMHTDSHRPRRGMAEVFEPAKRSETFKHIDELPAGTRVAVICRVSWHTQDHNGNLASQLAFAKCECERRGLIVVYTTCQVTSGMDPCWLGLHMQIAAEREATALVFSEWDRCIRPTDYHSVTRPNAELIEWDIRTIQHWARQAGLTLATVLNPEATPMECRAAQTKRGQAAKRNKGGRPIVGCKAFKAKWRPIALELREREGLGFKRIAQEITRWAGRSTRPLSHTTIKRWLYL